MSDCAGNKINVVKFRDMGMRCREFIASLTFVMLDAVTPTLSGRTQWSGGADRLHSCFQVRPRPTRKDILVRQVRTRSYLRKRMDSPSRPRATHNRMTGTRTPYNHSHSHLAH